MLQHSKVLVSILGAFVLQQHPSKVIATLLRSDVDRVPPLVAHMHRAVGISGAVLGAEVALGCLGIGLWRRGG